MRYGHLVGIGGESDLLKGWRRVKGLHERSIARGRRTREGEGGEETRGERGGNVARY